MVGIPDFRITPIPEQAWNDFVEEFRRVQAALPADKEIGIMANGAIGPIHIDSLRQNGQMIVFSGQDSDGREATLIQHYTQTSLLMIAVDKLESKAKRIGF